MKTRIATAALALLAASCVDNRGSISIAAICGLPDTGCTFASTCSAQYIGMLTYDVAAGAAMAVPVEVHNQLPQNGDGTVRTNTNTAHVTEIAVKYDTRGLTDSTGAALALPDDSTPVSETIPANGTAVIIAWTFSQAMTAYLNNAGLATTESTVVANVRLKGHLDDGSSFETGDFHVPVGLCSGCLVPPACTTGTLLGYCPGPGQSPSKAICGQ